MFGLRFLDNDSTDSENIYSFGNCDWRASLPLCNLLDMCGRWPRKWGSSGKVGLPSSKRHADGWLRFSHYAYALHKWLVSYCCAVNSPMRVNAWSCINVFETSDTKYYRRQSLWDEWLRGSHCPTNWGAFLLLFYRKLLDIETSTFTKRSDSLHQFPPVNRKSW